MNNGKVVFVGGIDTGIGKTVATGLLARALRQRGVNVITQKLVQTGCSGVSEDILAHRQLMGIDLLPWDLDGTTCPYVFPVPCSPHLAAELAGRRIEGEVLRQATRRLAEQYQVVLLEGAGGLLVPLDEETTLLDYLASESLPLVLVTSSRLGSINHTLAALEVTTRRGVDIALVLYTIRPEDDPRIVADSRRVFIRELQRRSLAAPLVDLLPLAEYGAQADLSPLADALMSSIAPF